MQYLQLARRFSQSLVLFSIIDISGAVADVAKGPTHGLYGTPGLIDMPTSENAPDASVAFSLSGYNGQIRSTLTFQILPGLLGSFRYSTLYNEGGQAMGASTGDRSFDLRYQVMPENALAASNFVRGAGFYRHGGVQWGICGWHQDHWPA